MRDDDRRTIDLLEAVWSDIAALCDGLTEAEWRSETDCPGWTVKDHLSHLTGTESSLLGRPEVEHTPPAADHVRNPIGERNEVQVDYRRSWPGARVLDEFREVTSERLKVLRDSTEDDFSKDSWTPIGPGQVRDFMQIRIFDSWVHDQDVRRALGRPGFLDGPVAQHAYGRIAQAMPFVVGKKAGAADGTTVIFEVSGFAPLAIGVEGGRAKPVSDPPAEPTVRLRMDLETFNILGCGRGPAGDRVRIEGDQDLGRRIVEQMAFMI